MTTNDDEMINTDITKAIEVFDRYKAIQKTQKIRGKNDFNPLTILLDPSDEVRLHSRFLHNLLSPSGTHCQGPLFLDLFLKVCGLSDFGIHTKNCIVHKEYHFIDLYITDKNKHIIIENKIYAADQDKQIERYIEIIKKENSKDYDLSSNLAVIYLSLDGSYPTDKSLGYLKPGKGTLIDNHNNEEYQIKTISYNKETLNWIKLCAIEVDNITNLSVGLGQYEDVILTLYNKYRSKLMNLSEYMKSQKNNSDVIRTFKGIHKEYEILRKDIIKEFFQGAKSEIAKKIPFDWGIDENMVDISTASSKPISIKHAKNDSVYFAVEFESVNYSDLFYGVTRKDESINLKCCLEEKEIECLLQNNKLNNKLNNIGNNKWWLTWGWCFSSRGDFLDIILEQGGVDVAVNIFVENIMDAFNANREIILKCDDILKTRSL